MTSLTSWLRLESRPRAASLTESLEARVHDPLWLLGRQWQLGEFKGEDTGTPVRVDLETRVSRFDRVAIGSVVRIFDPELQPLEVCVEHDRVSDDAQKVWRRAALHGLQFFRMLDRSLLRRYRVDILSRYRLEHVGAAAQDEHPLDTAFKGITAGRVPDGLAMARDWRPQPPATEVRVPAFVDRGDTRAFATAIAAWLSWRSSTLSEPDDGEQAWAGDRLRYRFAVGAPNPEPVTPRAPARRIVFDADDYRGGRLDWYAFDAATNNAQLGAPPLASGVTAATTSMLPTPLQFRGMPSPRWWEFEDGSVALGNVDVAPEDLARLLLVEFALCFSNDYFVVPVQLRPGSVSQVSRLSVTNTFGEVIAVAPMAPGGTRGKAWRMFSIADDAGGQLPHFVFPPVLAPIVESTPIEEVYFARDEMANAVWAIEKLVEGPAGQPRHTQETTQLQPEPPAAEPESDRPIWTFHLATPVPPHWYPYVPHQLPRGPGGQRSRSVQLQRTGGRTSLGALLSAAGSDAINEEEIPRRGVRVTRSYALARWLRGETFLWTTRRVSAGRGEAASGLAFDRVELQR